MSLNIFPIISISIRKFKIHTAPQNRNFYFHKYNIESTAAFNRKLGQKIFSKFLFYPLPTDFYASLTSKSSTTVVKLSEIFNTLEATQWGPKLDYLGYQKKLEQTPMYQAFFLFHTFFCKMSTMMYMWDTYNMRKKA